jgi:hypothetical protein
MNPPTRHIKILITSILAVFAIAATIRPEAQSPETNASSQNQRITLEKIRKVAIVSRELF